MALAALLLAATAGGTHPLHAAASVVAAEQGSITVDGEGTLASYPCGPCTPLINVVTAGYMTGVDGNNNPFTVSWGGVPATTVVPASQAQLTIDNSCSTGHETPDFFTLTATVYVYTAVMVYQGVSTQVNLQVTLGTQPEEQVPTTAPIVTMVFTASIGSTTVLTFIASATGAINFIPLGNDLCPLPQSPMLYTLNGTMASTD